MKWDRLRSTYIIYQMHLGIEYWVGVLKGQDVTFAQADRIIKRGRLLVAPNLLVVHLLIGDWLSHSVPIATRYSCFRRVIPRRAVLF